MSERRYSPLYELTVCRAKEFLREPEAVFWVFIFPLLLAVALGLAFRSKGPDQIPVGVVAGPAAERTLAVLAESPVLLARQYGAAAGLDALRTGRISLLVEAGPPTVFRFDETRPDSRIARLEADGVLQRAAGRKDPLPIESKLVTEKGSRYIDFLIPGLLGLNLMGTGIWSVAFSVASARTQRILKRLAATPMRKSDYLFSQILGRMGFLFPEMIVLIGAGWLLFDVPVRGSLLLLTVTCLLGATTFCGIGLLIAARVKTIEGVSGLGNLVMLPMWLLSGVFFSAERFPDALQPWIAALPLTALNDALRAIITEAQSLPEVAPQLGILTAWGVVSFAVALKLFRWK